MLLKNVLLTFISFSVVLSIPLDIIETRENEQGDTLVVRTTKKPQRSLGPSGKPAKDDPSKTSRMRAENNAPGRDVKRCKEVKDCSCPKKTDPKKTSSTSCINGACKCDDAAINFIGNKFIEGIKAIGNAPITKVIGEIMSGIATAKQVADVIAGAVLGPQAKAALRIALNAIPDTGPSHIDRASKNVINKVL